MSICTCKNGRRNSHCTAHMGFTVKRPSKAQREKERIQTHNTIARLAKECGEKGIPKTTCRFCNGDWNKKNKTKYSQSPELIDGLLFHRPIDGRSELGRGCTGFIKVRQVSPKVPMLKYAVSTKKVHNKTVVDVAKSLK